MTSDDPPTWSFLTNHARVLLSNHARVLLSHIGSKGRSGAGHKQKKTPPERGFPSAPGEIRTPDLRFRSSSFAGILR